METGGSRRRHTLSDENLELPNLRDFLRVKEGDNDGSNSLSGRTLRAALGSGKRQTPVQVNRTLLDIIKDDPNYGKESRKSWKALKNKLRLRRAGAAWTSSVSTPTSDIPIQNNSNRMISRRNSTRFNADGPSFVPTHPLSESTHRLELNPMMSNNRVPSLSASGYGHGVEGSAPLNNNSNDNAGVTEGAAEEEEGVEEMVEANTEEVGEPAVRMSLMALLAETDRQMGLDGSTYIVEDDEEEDDEEEVLSCGGGGVEYDNCCVCMVRHKRSAFIPCGHTFCRLCSRELWVQRGNCPLCNGFILEVLDIF